MQQLRCEDVASCEVRFLTTLHLDKNLCACVCVCARSEKQEEGC